MCCVTSCRGSMSISWSRRKSYSIATLVGDVRPFMFSVACLIDAICSSYGGLFGGALVLGYSLYFFDCVVHVLFLLRSCCSSLLFSSFIFFIRLGPIPASRVWVVSPSTEFSLSCIAPPVSWPFSPSNVISFLFLDLGSSWGFMRCGRSLISFLLSNGLSSSASMAFPVCGSKCAIRSGLEHWGPWAQAFVVEVLYDHIPRHCFGKGWLRSLVWPPPFDSLVIGRWIYGVGYVILFFFGSRWWWGPLAVIWAHVVPVMLVVSFLAPCRDGHTCYMWPVSPHP